jgi:hypothetical protein
VAVASMAVGNLGRSLAVAAHRTLDQVPVIRIVVDMAAVVGSLDCRSRRGQTL